MPVEDRIVDEFRATEVFRRFGRLEKLPEDEAERAKRVEEILQAISVFAAVSTNPGATVEQVLTPVLGANLFEVDHRLSEAFADKSPAPPAPARGEEESKKDRARRGWCALFATPWNQLQKYRTYLAGNSVLATHQVVKGSGFPHVMVVMDDKLAGGNQISYDKILEVSSLVHQTGKIWGKEKRRLSTRLCGSCMSPAVELGNRWLSCFGLLIRQLR